MSVTRPRAHAVRPGDAPSPRRVGCRSPGGGAGRSAGVVRRRRRGWPSGSGRRAGSWRRGSTSPGRPGPSRSRCAATTSWRDEPPGETFDLVHARLVLARIADRDEALRRMVQALRPGGWLVVEEIDVDFQPVRHAGRIEPAAVPLQPHPGRAAGPARPARRRPRAGSQAAPPAAGGRARRRRRRRLLPARPAGGGGAGGGQHRALPRCADRAPGGQRRRARHPPRAPPATARSTSPCRPSSPSGAAARRDLGGIRIWAGIVSETATDPAQIGAW